MPFCTFNPSPICKMQQPSSQRQGLLQDLLTPIEETWTTFPNGDPGTTGLFPTLWNSTFDKEEEEEEEEEIELLASSSSSFLQLISSSIQPGSGCSYTSKTIFPTVPSLDSFTPVNVSNSSSYEQQLYEYEYDDKSRSRVSMPSMVDKEDADHDSKIHEKQQVAVSDDQIPAVFSVGLSGEKKSKSKKVQGQPSKNLMAERRRRKRLNDRLLMLRSIVPMISKMDRTSILGDTIEYMKDLLEKIHNLKEQDLEPGSNSLNLMGSLKELKMKEAQARNPPKFSQFEVERRNIDTQIKICCSTKPGLLLSTVNTIEALGLDIQQCVISSFSDFSLQASCSEALENRAMTSSEEIEQILFRNAGYGGRYL